MQGMQIMYQDIEHLDEVWPLAASSMMADGSANLGRSGSFRKRPLEVTKSDGTEALPPKHSERSPPSDGEEMEISVSLAKQTSGLPNSEQQILDEVEEHFQRSLANVRGHSSKPRLLLQPANHHEQKSHHSHSSHSSHSHSHSHSHRHHSHSHHHQSTTNTQYRTILPKPHPSDAHDIVVTENSVASTTTKQTSPSTVRSTHTPMQTAPSASTTHTQQNVKQPVPANTTPSPQVISGSIPITSVAAISNIPTATQGLKIVDLVHSTNQKHSIAASAQPRTVPVATQNSIPGLVSVTQVPNMAAFSQHSVVSTTPQMPKMPVVAASAAPVSTAGSRSSRSPRKHTHSGRIPSTSAPSRPTPIPIPTQPMQQHQFAALAPQKTPTLTTVPTPPPIVPIIDPTMAQFTAGHSPILLVPGNFNLPLAGMSPQPYVLINPTDLGFQQAAAMVSAVSTPNLMGTTPNFINAGGILSNHPAASGYIVLPRGPFPHSMVNLAGTTIQQQAAGTSPTVSIMAETKPSPITVSSPRVAPTKPSTSIKRSTTSPIRLSAPSSNPLRRSLGETSPGDINLTPASVEDHFAKALGEQWSRVKNNLQPQALAAQSSVRS